ncbi:MAG: hypothetical protein AAFR88_13575 [Pseudomonadota bacterium]
MKKNSKALLALALVPLLSTNPLEAQTSRSGYDRALMCLVHHSMMVDFFSKGYGKRVAPSGEAKYADFNSSVTKVFANEGVKLGFSADRMTSDFNRSLDHYYEAARRNKFESGDAIKEFYVAELARADACRKELGV